VLHDPSSATSAELLAAFEAQVRQDRTPPHEGWVSEYTGPVLRSTAPAWTGRGGGIFWSGLGDLRPAEVDAVVAEQVAYFTALGRPFEWKVYGHDLPGDLPLRLVAAGLSAEEEEALVIGEVAVVAEACAGAAPPPEITVREARGSDFAGITALKESVWGGSGATMTAELQAEKDADPDALSIAVAVAPGRAGSADPSDGVVVCAAWIRFHAGTQFASLWGGTTLPQWRRRGIYRTLVARRAQQARERGYRYLQVDASTESRPILERLGMHVVSSTTPYVWPPPGAGG
jgi:ribosomal protein S18 acetylase RimI-like enzyme